MKTAILAALCALPMTISAALVPTVADAQSQPSGPTCGQRADVIERLRNRFGEERTGAGLSHANGVVEVFASAETGSWTIIVTLPTGQSCFVAAGENWQNDTAVLKSGQPV